MIRRHQWFKCHAVWMIGSIITIGSNHPCTQQHELQFDAVSILKCYFCVFLIFLCCLRFFYNDFFGFYVWKSLFCIFVNIFWFHSKCCKLQFFWQLNLKYLKLFKIMHNLVFINFSDQNIACFPLFFNWCSFYYFCKGFHFIGPMNRKLNYNLYSSYFLKFTYIKTKILERNLRKKTRNPIWYFRKLHRTQSLFYGVFSIL